MSNPSITKKEEWDAMAQEFYAYFLNWLKANGTSVDEIEEYNSLVGVKSLPARLDLGGVRKNVLIPIKILTKLQDDASENADSSADKANQAALNANVAADKANSAADRANEASDQLESIISDVESACDNANTAADRANELAEHPPKIGANKNWWIWNEDTQTYVDTNIIAEGNFLYSVFQIEPETLHLEIYAPKELEEQMFEIDKESGHLKLKLKMV